MTNKEALQSVLVGISTSDTLLEKAFVDNDVQGSAVYSKASEKGIDLCAVSVLQTLLSHPSISEGGFSINLNPDAVKARLLQLAKKHNLTEVLSQYKPAVKARNVW